MRDATVAKTAVLNLEDFPGLFSNDSNAADSRARDGFDAQPSIQVLY